MNDNEIQRIAAATNALRPDWPTKSIETLLRTKLNTRPRRDVAVALAWVACESGSTTPARVLEAGPWWNAAAVEGATSKRDLVAPEERCGTCGRVRGDCRDHEFESLIDARQRKSAGADPTSEYQQARRIT